MARTKHYHVTSGPAGFFAVPDNDVLCETRRDAERFAARMVRDYAASGYRRASGTVRAWRVLLAPPTGNVTVYVKVETHDDGPCLARFD